MIKQKGKPTACHSRKLTEPQKKHSAIEKELWAILETAEQFRSFLWGRKTMICADHSNLSFDQSKSTGVKNWRLLIEDFKSEIEDIKGDANADADTPSRCPMSDKPIP